MPHYGSDIGSWKNPPPETIRNLIKDAETIAIVGLSPESERPSYRVAEYLKQNGYRIIPVRPVVKEILGEIVYPDLKSIPEKVDIVDVFRKAEVAMEITEASIKIGARAVWLQESIVSPEAFAFGEEAGLTMIMDRCLKKEHRALLGRG